MRMLRWMIGKTRKDRMINDIKDNLRVALIEDNARKPLKMVYRRP